MGLKVGSCGLGLVGIVWTVYRGCGMVCGKACAERMDGDGCVQGCGGCLSGGGGRLERGMVGGGGRGREKAMK